MTGNQNPIPKFAANFSVLFSISFQSHVSPIQLFLISITPIPPSLPRNVVPVMKQNRCHFFIHFHRSTYGRPLVFTFRERRRKNHLEKISFSCYLIQSQHFKLSYHRVYFLLFCYDYHCIYFMIAHVNSHFASF